MPTLKVFLLKTEGMATVEYLMMVMSRLVEATNFRDQTQNINIVSFIEQAITSPAKTRVGLYL